MKNRFLIPLILVLILVAGGFFGYRALKAGFSGRVATTPTPTPPEIEQLTPDKQPKVSLSFTSDGHYVTVNISDIYAQGLEYNLIYDATVKKNVINTGVTATAKLGGTDKYSNKQLLGSESSGKFTYHENIKNAVMELTLRNPDGYSVFSATYPFSVSPGKTVSLTASN